MTKPEAKPPKTGFGLARLVVLACLAFGITYGATRLSKREAPAPEGMVWIPPATFEMGSNAPRTMRNEQPVHQVTLDGFWIDAHEVTNDEFARYVAATGYVTTAERKPEWEELKKTLPPDSEKPADAKLVPGALVFVPPDRPVPLDGVAWWQWVAGASWKHPEGPASDLKGRGDHPVVQVSWDDATAYAKWAGKRLPTEAEWECAARGGLANKRFSWGDEPPNPDHPRANIWDGTFPTENTKRDGFVRTSPVKSFSPNAFGLYDTAGNVWEWCSDWYRADAYANTERGVAANPAGPLKSFDPDDPYAPKRVTRGGSFLCHESYCESYRPSARRGTAPDTGLSHVGFRCAQSGPRR